MPVAPFAIYIEVLSPSELERYYPKTSLSYISSQTSRLPRLKFYSYLHLLDLWQISLPYLNELFHSSFHWLVWALILAMFGSFHKLWYIRNCSLLSPVAMWLTVDQVLWKGYHLSLNFVQDQWFCSPIFRWLLDSLLQKKEWSHTSILTSVEVKARVSQLQWPASVPGQMWSDLGGPWTHGFWNTDAGAEQLVPNHGAYTWACYINALLVWAVTEIIHLI